jgi:hypothetical protein
MQEIMKELKVRCEAYYNLIERIEDDKELRLILISKQSELCDIINLLEK